MADTGNKAVKEILAVGGSIQHRHANTLDSSFSDPTGVAVDGVGQRLRGRTRCRACRGDAGGWRESRRPTINASGRDSTNRLTLRSMVPATCTWPTTRPVIKEIVAVGGSIPASPTINTLGSGFYLPLGVAIR